MRPNVWEFVKKLDDTFEILHNGELVKDSIPKKWLEAELVQNGFCGQEFHEILQQLEMHRRAKKTL